MTVRTIQKRTEWARQQVISAAKASKHLGLNAHAAFSGALLWHTMHPWPQRPEGLVKMGFKELAKRWLPLLNEFQRTVLPCVAKFTREDLHDGVTLSVFSTLQGITLLSIFCMTPVTLSCNN